MNIIFYITAFIILLYFAYPLWLKLLPSSLDFKEEAGEEIRGVSLVLLSFNGMPYLKDKIRFLLDELETFDHHELIVIDDHSMDGSQSFLANLQSGPTIRIILNEKQKGIPNSMNLGVEQARHEVVIFCDQRQSIKPGTLKRLVLPLSDARIGAVSACISSTDKDSSHSSIRSFENFIKMRESRTGCLVGVYGPCYAIRKSCYSKLPEDVILDDLYLSLRIMHTRSVILEEHCQVVDNNLSELYSIGRASRYLAGFYQIWKHRDLIRGLNLKQKTMLFWHKYLRLIIPPFIALSYLNLGVLALKDNIFLLVFILVTLSGLILLTPRLLKRKNGLSCLLKVNICYLAGVIGLIFRRKKGKQEVSSERSLAITELKNN